MKADKTSNDDSKLLERIKPATEERKLHALAWECHGPMKADLITPEYYGVCMLALVDKLGFPPLEENLKTAVDFEND
jgi:hypothetical protein